MKHLRGLFQRLPGRRAPAQQVGALCRDPDSGKVLLITSRGTGRWIIPKGWPMAGRSLSGAAAQEAWEEAGVRGDISAQELGRYRYDKARNDGMSIPVEVHVFPITVRKLADSFPESHQRRRAWFAPQEAAARVAEPGLKSILRRLPT